jgi:RHS repeat-associated protein
MNKILKFDPRGFAVTSTYDSLNREIIRVFPNSSRFTFGFDPVGRQTQMQDLTGFTTYSYDHANRLVSVVAPYAPAAMTYIYDSAGNRTGLTDPDGGATNYSYDSQNRLTKILNPYNEITTIAYDPLDREITKIMANSQITSHTYDQAGRETALTNRLLSSIAVLSAHTATYDPAGNKVAVSETITGEGPFGLTYTYDPSNQLLSEQRYGSRPYSNTFTYDPAGNQLSVTAANGHPTTNTYNAANGLILSTPGTGQPTTVSYDLAGNRLLQNTSGALTTFTWDYENRNTLLVPSSGAPLTNLYDATGLRRFDGTDSYIWDQQNVLQVRTASTGAKYYQFTNSPGNWFGLVSEYEPSFGSSQFYAFDQSGNTRVATHKPGDVTSTVDYTAFGTQYYLTGGSNLPFRFGGQWGYYMPGVPIWILYIQQRWLDVALAQWTSRDLIGFDGGDWNLYRYVGNGGLSRIDPLGDRRFGDLAIVAGHLRPLYDPEPNSECTVYEDTECYLGCQQRVEEQSKACGRRCELVTCDCTAIRYPLDPMVSDLICTAHVHCDKK